eukprot:GILK01006086.1.p1 GENE.GILK01006086.1~~GILK01006086.1.p1  ORF type:complete len:335 (+),score=36.52 GILK01006086.1:340-1344(+)
MSSGPRYILVPELQSCRYYYLTMQAIEAAAMIRNATYVVAFTGAGISTSSGINDYRGTSGVDTKASLKQEDDQDTEEVQYEKLLPTKGHTALASLHKAGLLHYVITQNCDDLHFKSGVPFSAISELHGNVFVEYCEDCKKEYHRKFCVDLYSTDCYMEPWYEKCSTCGHNHYTGRRCGVKTCKGKLRDTIVNFGDLLHESVLGGLPAAERACDQADVCLCLGTSLTITPASDLTLRAKERVICNLQKTEQDKTAVVRVFAETDSFLTLLQEALLLPSSATATTAAPESAALVTRPTTTEKKRKINSMATAEDASASSSMATRRAKVGKLTATEL